MIDDKKLRLRILAALNLSLLATTFDVVACGSSDESSGKKGLSSVTCSNGTLQIQCWAPHETHFNVGNVAPGTPVSTPAPIFDANGCQAVEQVADGCCNAAAGGPEFDNGQCCYAFCTGACCGRPLLVDGAPRLSPLVPRDDWASNPFDAASLGGLDEQTRRRIADEWLADGRMEHASIASFARFTLDLLAFGAPPELIEGAQRAALDEITHARLCFGIAGVYAGAQRGPGALSVEGVTASPTLADAALAALREGCIGETTAALLAAERARATEIPALRAVYERIADDEGRHAELAFRFVTWAVAEGGAEVREAVSSAIGALRVSGARARSITGHSDLHAHGRLSDDEVRDVEQRAASEVILPCLAAFSALPAPYYLRAERSGSMLLAPNGRHVASSALRPRWFV